MEPGFIECNSTNLPKVDFDVVYRFMAEERAGEAAGTSKEQRSARPNYGDQAIGRVQIRRDGHICTIKCKLTPEHRIRAKAYTVSCRIDEIKDEIIFAQCEDCPASEGGCKHRMAFIMWLHRRSEEPSPTEVSSYWKKSILCSEGLEPILISKFTHREDEIYNLPSTSDVTNFTTAIMENYSSNAALSTVLNNSDSLEVLDLHRVVQKCISYEDFTDKISSQLTQERVKLIEKITKGQASNTKWHLGHYGRITASKFHSVAHCKTADGSLLNAILGEKIMSTEAMQRGSLLEEEVFKMLKTKFQSLRKCGLFLNPLYPVFGASPDGITNKFIIEIKCPSSNKTLSNYIKDGIINKKYILQMQLQMAICNKQKGYFVVADPEFERKKEFMLLEVKYCKELLEEYIEKASTYYKNYVYSRLL